MCLLCSGLGRVQNCGGINGLPSGTEVFRVDSCLKRGPGFDLIFFHPCDGLARDRPLQLHPEASVRLKQIDGGIA